MSVPGQRLRQMQHEVTRFDVSGSSHQQNHKRYVAEAAQCLRGAEDALDALRFLDKLMTSPFASRQQERQALNDIGEWLGLRLLHEPYLDRTTLAWELGWLQRLVAIRGAQAGFAGRAPPNQGAPLTGFSGRIAEIEKRRAIEARAARSRARLAPRKAPPRAVPEQLPDVFEVEFADVDAARDARRTARKREKAGKTKKQVWLPLKPIDGRLRELAKGLSCTLETKGCEAVFDDMVKGAGRPRAFWVAEVRTENGRQVVARITLERPA